MIPEKLKTALDEHVSAEIGAAYLRHEPLEHLELSGSSPSLEQSRTVAGGLELQQELVERNGAVADRRHDRAAVTHGKRRILGTTPRKAGHRHEHEGGGRDGCEDRPRQPPHEAVGAASLLVIIGSHGPPPGPLAGQEDYPRRRI